MTAVTPVSEDRRERQHPRERRCDVYRVSGGTDCAGVSIAWFTATCDQGHRIEGSACSPCANAVMLGCANCWLTDRRYSRVTLTFEELVSA